METFCLITPWKGPATPQSVYIYMCVCVYEFQSTARSLFSKRVTRRTLNWGKVMYMECVWENKSDLLYCWQTFRKCSIIIVHSPGSDLEVSGLLCTWLMMFLLSIYTTIFFVWLSFVLAVSLCASCFSLSYLPTSLRYEKLFSCCNFGFVIWASLSHYDDLLIPINCR